SSRPSGVRTCRGLGEGATSRLSWDTPAPLSAAPGEAQAERQSCLRGTVRRVCAWRWGALATFSHGPSPTGRVTDQADPGAPKVREPRRRSASRLRTRFQRSEEHTSELQSRENLVCRLLLEKKNALVHYHK